MMEKRLKKLVLQANNDMKDFWMKIQDQHAGLEKSSEDVEDAYDLNLNIPQPDTHTADPTCLAILSILKKLLCFCLFSLFVKFF